MGAYREEDPLAILLAAEQMRVVECVLQFATVGGAGHIAEARRILRALGDAETNVLYPAFSRVALRPETERLLEDCRGNRAQQLAALDVVAHKRAPRLRKLAALEVCDQINHHGIQHVSLLVPVLSSQLPRPLYRSICQAFKTRYEGGIEVRADQRSGVEERSAST
jgi:hypothetical protein